VITGVLGIVAGILAIACGWLAWSWLSARGQLGTAAGGVGAAAERTARAESDLAAAEGQIAGLEASVSVLSSERADLLAERDELRQELQRATAAHGRLEQDLTRERSDHAAVAAALSRERDRSAAAEQAMTAAAVRTNEYRGLLDSIDPSMAAPGESASSYSASRVPGATWPILLATLARRWAAAVGAPPDTRGVRTGTVSEQLIEALGRESERLREEVGVDVEVHAGGSVEPTDPVTFLLAATDVLGVLAAVCERVVMHLDDGLVLTGEGWSGPADELELARARAAASGMTADTLSVDGESVTVTLRPRAPATT
jgi:hypothetical protein